MKTDRGDENKYIKQNNRVGAAIFYLKMEADPVSETCFLRNIRQWT
jgi:hypothetical protein